MPSLGNSLQVPYGTDNWMVLGNDYYSYYGSIVSCGWRATPGLSLGVGLGAAFRRRSYSNDYLGKPPADQRDPRVDNADYWLAEDAVFTGIVAAAARNPSGSLAWDLVASWSNERLFCFDANPAVRNYAAYGAPLYIEQTLSWSPNRQKTFLALKQVNDIYLDRDLYYGRLMPCVEQWFFDLFAVRLGAEGSVVARGGGTELGWGATAGATVKAWKLELDVSYTIRQRPSRSLVGVTIPEYVFFVTVSADGLLFGD